MVVRRQAAFRPDTQAVQQVALKNHSVIARNHSSPASGATWVAIFELASRALVSWTSVADLTFDPRLPPASSSNVKSKSYTRTNMLLVFLGAPDIWSRTCRYINQMSGAEH